ncbi:hypothetical protein BDZ89DRAFT_1056447 [Hymenopellis radicata]|nr:hypothetical protein BDZ89DRAFT_1056447 [Hymenopellis radicata]
MAPKKPKKAKTVEEPPAAPVQPLAVQHVLHNGDLLGIICELLHDTWKTYRSTIPTSERIHPLVALAMTNKVISAVALNTLWKHLDSLRPIVALFSESTEQSKAEGRYSSSREPALCEDIPEATWCRFDSYVHRIQGLTFSKSFSSKYLLRFAERRRPIFPNLRKLTVSLELASDPAILFIHAPRTSHIELRFPSTPDKEQTITAISTIAWNLPNIHTLILTISEERYYYSSEPAALTFSVTFNKLSSSNLRRLEIAHSVDRAMLLVFSKFQRLEHLTIHLCETGAGKEVSFTDTGFTCLTSLKIHARVAEMPKIVKIFPNEILRSLEFTDTSEPSTDRAASMEEFHALLVTKMSTLQELKLFYGTRKSNTSTRGAFGQLERLAAVRHLSYQGDVALDEDVIRHLIPSWRKMVSLHINSGRNSVPYTVLPEIAKDCPDLVTLNLNVLFPSSDTLVPPPIINHRLQRFDAPETSTLRDLQSLLDACQPARRDQRERELSQLG